MLDLRSPNKHLSGTIDLPLSKSETNRALIIIALSRGTVTLTSVSAAEDSQTMTRLLRLVSLYDSLTDPPLLLDVGAAGTVMRFLTAFLCTVPGEFILTGSNRMRERPIMNLIVALRALGARIDLLAEDAAPLVIQGGQLRGGSISMSGETSSQFVSALALCAPHMQQGLNLSITGKLVSEPYLLMTLEMMAAAGIVHRYHKQILRVENQAYQTAILSIEADWSAASYWFSMVALSENGTVFLRGLRRPSLQGDAQIATIMAKLGVESKYESGGVTLTKTREAPPVKELKFDFSSCPDLAQTVIATLAGLRLEATITGLETLPSKETNRILALQKELSKLGATLSERSLNGRNHYSLTCHSSLPNSVAFSTYEDHRMAMALAPLALVIPVVSFDDEKVVRKSYPHYWEDLQKVGFSVARSNLMSQSK